MNTISIWTDDELLTTTRAKVAEEKRLTLEILHLLWEIEARRLYATRGYSSLFEFATRELGYSEGSAQRRIDAMRLLKEVPEMENKIQEGKLTLASAARAQSFFRQEKKSQRPLKTEEKKAVLEKLENKSIRECDRVLATLTPEPEKFLKRDSIRPVTEELSEIRFIASQELLEELEELKALLSHRYPQITMAELIKEMADATLEKLRPKPPKASPPARAVKSRAIPAQVKRIVYARDQGRCTYRDPETGKSCGSRHFLEFDHRIPYAKGGTTTPENLRLLCRAHNQLRAIQSFGRGKMKGFLNRRKSQRDRLPQRLQRPKILRSRQP